ncbi:hypothetical protein [Nostoc sp. DSM 114167]|uniref:hypothetical protein n=1 Tax=Nostoc sp. DSM 114167 TaxID=3439050 RepID=UPI004045C464
MYLNHICGKGTALLISVNLTPNPLSILVRRELKFPPHSSSHLKMTKYRQNLQFLVALVPMLCMGMPDLEALPPVRY